MSYARTQQRQVNDLNWIVKHSPHSYETNGAAPSYTDADSLNKITAPKYIHQKNIEPEPRKIPGDYGLFNLKIGMIMSDESFGVIAKLEKLTDLYVTYGVEFLPHQRAHLFFQLGELACHEGTAIVNQQFPLISSLSQRVFRELNELDFNNFTMAYSGFCKLGLCDNALDKKLKRLLDYRGEELTHVNCLHMIQALAVLRISEDKWGRAPLHVSRSNRPLSAIRKDLIESAVSLFVQKVTAHYKTLDELPESDELRTDIFKEVQNATFLSMRMGAGPELEQKLLRTLEPILTELFPRLSCEEVMRFTRGLVHIRHLPLPIVAAMSMHYEKFLCNPDLIEQSIELGRALQQQDAFRENSISDLTKNYTIDIAKSSKNTSAYLAELCLHCRAPFPGLALALEKLNDHDLQTLSLPQIASFSRYLLVCEGAVHAKRFVDRVADSEIDLDNESLNWTTRSSLYHAALAVGNIKLAFKLKEKDSDVDQVRFYSAIQHEKALDREVELVLQSFKVSYSRNTEFQGFVIDFFVSGACGKMVAILCDSTPFKKVGGDPERKNIGSEVVKTAVLRNLNIGVIRISTADWDNFQDSKEAERWLKCQLSLRGVDFQGNGHQTNGKARPSAASHN